MSLVAMNRIWDQSTQTGTPLVILLALADRADEDGICWPGVEWIAQRARLQPRQARNVLRALEDSGDLITVSQRGRNHTNRYLITSGLDSDQIAAIVARRPDVFPAGCPQKTGNPSSQNRQSSAENRQSSVNKTGNFETENRQSSAENRQSSVDKPAIAIAADPLEPLKQPPIKPPLLTAAAAAIPTPAAERDGQMLLALLQGRGFMYLDSQAKLLAVKLEDEYTDAQLRTALDTTTKRHQDLIKTGKRGITAPLAYLRSVLAGMDDATTTKETNHDNRPAHRGPNPPTKPADPAPENIYNQLLGWTTT